MLNKNAYCPEPFSAHSFHRLRRRLASAGRDEQQALHVLRSAQEDRRISFRDHFAGTTESLPHMNIPLLPDEQAALAQVTRPLQLS